jgi:hypothetical protein
MPGSPTSSTIASIAAFGNGAKALVERDVVLAAPPVLRGCLDFRQRCLIY